MTLRLSVLLEPPPGVRPGPATALVGLQIGDEFVVKRKECRCCKNPTSRFFVYGSGSEAVCMAISWRRLCHYRGWQFDPVEELRRPGSWKGKLSAWQRLVFGAMQKSKAANADAPSLEADPIPWCHPDQKGDPLPSLVVDPRTASSPEPPPPPPEPEPPPPKVVCKTHGQLAWDLDPPQIS